MELIETTLLNKELSDVIIDNFINILYLGINLKTLNKNAFVNFDFEYFYEEKKDIIPAFDHNKAIELINKLTQKKKEKKVLTFNFN